MTAPLLELHGIRRSVDIPGRGELLLLDDVALDVAAGEVVAIVGRSGSGKTTLLHILGLLDTPDAGAYRIDGVDTRRLGERGRSRLRGTTFGFVFQQFELLERRSALANVAAPLLSAPRPQRRARFDLAAAALARVGLTERSDSTPAELSGGEAQRVAIARALVRKPRCVLADEPTGALDVETGAATLTTLLDLAHRDGVAVVLITHDPDVAARADRILSLAEGHLVRAGTAELVAASMRHAALPAASAPGPARTSASPAASQTPGLPSATAAR